MGTGFCVKVMAETGFELQDLCHFYAVWSMTHGAGGPTKETGRQGQQQSEVATTLIEMALQVSLPGTALETSSKFFHSQKFQRKLRGASLVETVGKYLAS